MKQFSVVLFVLLYSVMSMAEDEQLAEIFERNNANGTIVISSIDGRETLIHNNSRADYRFSTASTFKILNSLIALEERVVSSKDSILKWNGTQYDYPSWNHDQTIESAFKASCVWCYQELAKIIGVEKYRIYLKKLHYGHLDEPFNETTFWLDGSLKISAREQIKFLKQIYHRTLPFSESSYNVLQEIMIAEESDSYTIRAKTGWAARVDPQVGWYVGYVQSKDNVWFFATNLQINNKNDLVLRKNITYEALNIKGII